MSSAPNPAHALPTTGLRYWVESVLQECDRVSDNFAADPVHDLRVALRRCRSMADGLLALDPHPDWKAMKKAGKRLFQRLGELRDIQIMMDWIEKLEPKVQTRMARPLSPAFSGSAGSLAESSDPHSDTQLVAARDPAAHTLLQILKQRETERKREAKAALAEFDRKQWRRWSRSLPARAAHIRLGSPLFKHLALERWMTARELHTRALRVRSQVAWHSLRIGIKRFRYIVENFLPEEHKLWSRDLKQIQDALGEVHDFDVLWATAVASHVFPDENSRKVWHEIIVAERNKRIELYRSRMVGPDSLWQQWRERLPQGEEIQKLAERRMKLWAKALDPDFAHSEHVAKLALELYEGLRAAKVISDGSDPQESLLPAALLHDVGKSKAKKGHHKHSFELIQAHGAMPGWDRKDMHRAAVIARFHSGALPSRSHRLLRDLLPNEQKSLLEMAGVLRLANALDDSHDGHIRNVKIENGTGEKIRPGECVVIAAEGYSSRSATARTVAAERYLLETVLRRPLMIKAAKPYGSRVVLQIVNTKTPKPSRNRVAGQ